MSDGAELATVTVQADPVRNLVPSFGFNAETMSPEENTNAWREAVGTLFEVDELAVGEAKPFRADLISFAMGTLVIGATRASGQRFRRTLQTIARSGVDHILIQLYTSGGYDGVAGAETMRVRAGDVCVLDMAQTLETRATPFENITLVVPRPVLSARLTRLDVLHGMVLNASDVMAVMIGRHLRTLVELAPRLTMSDSEAVVTGSIGLVAACLRAAAERRENLMEARSVELAIRIKQHIETRLADTLLSRQTIAEHFGLSRASLYRLFTPHGGVASYIRSRRLHRAFFDLATSTLRIKEVSRRWCLGSEAHFTRAFRATYGITPMMARNAAMISGGQTEELGSHLSKWMRNMAAPR